MAAQGWGAGSIASNGNPNPNENPNPNGNPNSTNESIPSVSTSDGTNDSHHGDDDESNDAEGVWSPDIEQSFQEALAIYPPCGRRKIILSDEGKMYGRNELIARYIKLRTGKSRSRKQVSSHIQVLARRKSKDIQTQLKGCPNSAVKEKAMQGLNALSSAQILSGSSFRSGGAAFASPHHQQNAAGVEFPHVPPAAHPSFFYPPSLPGASAYPSMEFMRQPPGVSQPQPFPGLSQMYLASNQANADSVQRDVKPPVIPQSQPLWVGRTIAGPKLRLCEFLSFVEIPKDNSTSKQPKEPPRFHKLVEIKEFISYGEPMLEEVEISQIYDKFPSDKGGLRDLYERGPPNAFFLVKFWADISVDVAEDSSTAVYAVNSRYESEKQMNIICSTKVCSFGRQVVEKVETEYGKLNGSGRFEYKIDRSKMCEYMITFIHRLKQLPQNDLRNNVLENFTILQVIQSKETLETLLCIAMVFEVTESSGSEPQHNIYKLIHH